MSQTRHKTSLAVIRGWLADGVPEDDIVRRLIECDQLTLRRAQDRLMIARGYGDTIAVDENGIPLPDEEQRRLWKEHLHQG